MLCDNSEKAQRLPPRNAIVSHIAGARHMLVGTAALAVNLIFAAIQIGGLTTASDLPMPAETSS